MERSFWSDLGLVVLTLGFYIPYWAWKRNQELREEFPDLALPDNLWWLVGGTAVSLLGAYVRGVAQASAEVVQAFGGAYDVAADVFLGSAMSVLGILGFSYGVFLLARNGEEAADAVGLDWRVPAGLFGGLFAAAFLMVEAGHLFETWLVRLPALLMVAAQPLLFYQVYEDLEDVEAMGIERRPPSGGPPQGAAPTS